MRPWIRDEPFDGTISRLSGAYDEMDRGLDTGKTDCNLDRGESRWGTRVAEAKQKCAEIDLGI